MKNLRQNPSLLIKMTESRGRGVFAGGYIKEGETFEVCPAVICRPGGIKGEGEGIEDQDIFDKYLLPFIAEGWPDTFKGQHMSMVGGYAMFYNHSEDPNAEYDAEVFEDGNHVILFKALRDIREGEEITHDYGGGYGKVTFGKGGCFEVEVIENTMSDMIERLMAHGA